MTGEPATVLSVDGKFATVLRVRHSICLLCPDPDECSEQEHERCGMEIRAVNRVGAKGGDQVIVRLEGQQFLIASMLVYGVPLVFMAGGLAVGSWLGASLDLAPPGIQGLGAVGLLASLLLALPVSRSIDERVHRSGAFTPVIVEVRPGRMEV